MKKILFFLILAFNAIFAQTYTSEYYEKQAQILRNLDIDPSFMSDLIFVQIREELESKHSGVLVNSIQNFSKVTPMIRKVLAKEEVPEEILYLAMIE